MKKNIFWYATRLTIIGGIIAIVKFVDLPNMFSILNIFEDVKIEKSIDVSIALDMSAHDAVDYLELDAVDKDYWSIRYYRSKLPSYLECDFNSYYKDIPSAWDFYIKDNAFSLYDIVPNITSLEEANEIITQEGWCLKGPDINSFDDATIDSVEYEAGFNKSKTVVFIIDSCIVKEIQILNLKDENVD